MRYKININKTINQLIPWFIAGRKNILYLSAILKPLQNICDEFEEWATETRIEASMTSQVYKLEWFLNRKFKIYFEDQEDRIFISDKIEIGVPMYNENAVIPGSENFTLYNEAESGKQTEVLYYQTEQTEQNTSSFIVNIPRPNTKIITTEEYLSIVKYYIDKYKISGKTYKIIFTTND